MVSYRAILGLAAAVFLSFQTASASADGGRFFHPRPDIKPGPLQPYKAFPVSPPRTKTCFVKPSCTRGRDGAPKILAAFQECNNGGTVVLDSHYTVCSQLDLRFLQHVDVALTGTITFCDDVDYWTAIGNTILFAYQNQSSWWVFGGDDINIYGAGLGTLDGQGQVSCLRVEDSSILILLPLRRL